MKNCIGILLGAGKGSRLQTNSNKIFVTLEKKSLFQLSIENICRFQRLTAIILVISNLDKPSILKLLTSFEIKVPYTIVIGGKTRWESCLEGIKQFLNLYPNQKFFFIHDIARPFVSLKMLERLYQTCHQSQVAIPYLRPKATIWLQQQKKQTSLAKQNLFISQTPQFFKTSLATFFSGKNLKQHIPTDDAFFTVQAGIPITWVLGEEQNIKITTPFDLEVAKVLLKNRL